LYRALSIYISLFLFAVNSFGQEIPDSLRRSAYQLDDTTGFYLLVRDTTANGEMLLGDSIAAKSPDEVVIEAPIEYNAKDSIIFSLDGQRVYMYGDSKVNYQQVELTAAHIILDLETKEVYAEGMPDSTGVLAGKPIFQDGSEKFESKTLRYNFQTQKGIITDVVTEQGEGFVHSSRAKKISADAFILQKGKYTTCDADHPHFYLNLSKAKIVSNNKIITGPAYMVLEDFPLYFPVIPFGYFPSSPRYSSGILVPSYGEEANRGFFLREGGYYWAANEYFDVSARGDIYSKGSWGAKLHTNYRVRYRFSGGFDFRYSENVYGERGLDTYSSSPQFQVMWSHSQDAKANPSRNFSANVNFSTSGYDKQNALSAQNYLRTQKSSSISYAKRWENTPFSMSANLRHSQNSTDSTLTLSMPEMTFNVAKMYPLKFKNRIGSAKWYEKFGFSYSSNMRNTITAREDEILQKSLVTDWKNGIQHNLPISLPNFNLLKFINVSPSFSYNEKWYFRSIEKTYVPDRTFRDERNRITHVRTDTITGLKRNYQYAYSLSATTNIYGMYMPVNPDSRIKGIRHKMTPSLSFSYNPDFGDPRFGFWREVQVDSTGRMEPYTIFEGGIYGSTGRGAAGNISFSLSNNLEMKVADLKDTTATAKFKKVKLIDNLSLNTSYNMIADSFNLSPISIRGRTTISGVGINFGTMLDPYITNDRGRRISQYAWDHNKGLAKLGRFTNANLSFGMQFNSKEGRRESEEAREAIEEDNVLPGDFQNYVDFNIPWNVGFDYSFTYNRPNPNEKARLMQTISLRGSLTLTKSWRVNMNTNYDITAKAFSFTNFSVYRDMHCWEMSLNFVPFGYMKSYSFTLNARTSMLKDLKVTKQRSFYDNF
jgi:lipopolysaccharide assembly outer membrane protein LptD (OstA)